MSNRTFTIVKPDSVRKNNFGRIISRLEAAGFRVLGVKKIGLSQRRFTAFIANARSSAASSNT
jgi:nucleoside-diphosphate kinase